MFERVIFLEKGKMYGNWLVLEVDTSRDKDKNLRSLVQCPCGRKIEKRNSDIFNLKTKSCPPCFRKSFQDTRFAQTLYSRTKKKPVGRPRRWYEYGSSIQDDLDGFQSKPDRE